MPALALTLMVALATTQKPATFTVGVQAYSFNRFTSFQAIEKTAQAGATTIELYPGQKLSPEMPVGVGPDMGADAEAALKTQLEKYGVDVRAFGVTGISGKEEDARKLFTWAKRMGIEILNTESADAIDTIEKMVKEFDISVGFHNHPKQPNNTNYKVWDPAYIYSLVKDRDVRIGSCADTGHWVRSGIKPLDALKTLKGRVVSSHLKDLHEFSRGGHDVPWGQGVSDIPGILAAYKKMGFKGHASVEYEYNWDNSLPDIAQCIGFARAITSSK